MATEATPVNGSAHISGRGIRRRVPAAVHANADGGSFSPFREERRNSFTTSVLDCGKRTGTPFPANQGS